MRWLSKIGGGIKTSASKRMLKPVHLHAHAYGVEWLYPVQRSLQHRNPALNTGTHTDSGSINSTMECTSLLQPGMAGREVRRELEADGAGVG